MTGYFNDKIREDFQPLMWMCEHKQAVTNKWAAKLKYQFLFASLQTTKIIIIYNISMAPKASWCYENK